MFRPILFTVALVAATPLVAQVAEKSMPKAQLMKNAEDEFAKVDTNKDGQMSKTEIETFQRSVIMSMNAQRSKEAFNALDTDKNGVLSSTEFSKINGGEPKVDITNIMRIDTNKDGQISLAEHRAATLETFNKVDANKDGVLTANEVQAMMTKK